MLRCMYSGISGMKVNQTKLDVIGNNIANVGTTGFKSSRAEFTDMLYQNSAEATAPTSTKGGTNAKQIGLGAKLSSINKVMGQGNALSTGRTLDVCVDGDGYLMVAKGSAGGSIGVTSNAISTTGGSMDGVLYTRDGNLTLDKDGNLLTADGYRVMGYSIGGGLTRAADGTITTKIANPDGTTKLTPDETKLIPLAIPDSVTNGSNKDPIKKFEIGKDGVITAVLGSGTRTVLGQIAMASFKNPEGLTGVGGNLQMESSNSGSAIIRSASGTTATATDNSKGFGDIVQGALEGSNVDLTEQFTDMITATRSFQASSKMVTTGDEILQTITGLMR